MKKLLSIAFALVLVLSLVSCGKATPPNDAEPSVISTEPTHTGSGENTTALHHVEMTFDGYGTVTLELNTAAAPITATHFLDLVRSGYYDGTSIIRVQVGFVIQGGRGAGAEKIKGEFSSNGVSNPIKHKRGTLSMARSTDPDSASDQFFICLNDSSASQLDGNYAAFGSVTDGFDVLDKIVNACNNINCLDLSNLRLAQMGFLNTESYIKILSAKIID